MAWAKAAALPEPQMPGFGAPPYVYGKHYQEAVLQDLEHALEHPQILPFGLTAGVGGFPPGNAPNANRIPASPLYG